MSKVPSCELHQVELYETCRTWVVGKMSATYGIKFEHLRLIHRGRTKADILQQFGNFLYRTKTTAIRPLNNQLRIERKMCSVPLWFPLCVHAYCYTVSWCEWHVILSLQPGPLWLGTSWISSIHWYWKLPGIWKDSKFKRYIMLRCVLYWNS